MKHLVNGAVMTFMVLVPLAWGFGTLLLLEAGHYVLGVGLFAAGIWAGSTIYSASI